MNNESEQASDVLSIVALTLFIGVLLMLAIAVTGG
jgi:hypothetical protein